MRYWLVMPAAGAGRRFGADLPKQYAQLRGRSVIEWALAPFIADPRCAGIAVALAADDPHWARVSARLPAVTVVAGGVERSQSVRNALTALADRAQASDWVLVHDAARPCLAAADRDRLLASLASHPVGGLLAVPLADTLKRSEREPVVHETVDRTHLWRALTPQMFRYANLCAALDRAFAAQRFPSDEAQAFEWLGERPVLVPGAATNFKITSATDLALAAAVLGADQDSKP